VDLLLKFKGNGNITLTNLCIGGQFNCSPYCMVKNMYVAILFVKMVLFKQNCAISKYGMFAYFIFIWFRFISFCFFLFFFSIQISMGDNGEAQY
jgi:hypothetical protein